MHKIKAFSKRNQKEILRDPLSYIFCLGFPLVMLFVMTIVNERYSGRSRNDNFQN